MCEEHRGVRKESVDRAEIEKVPVTRIGVFGR